MTLRKAVPVFVLFALLLPLAISIPGYSQDSEFSFTMPESLWGLQLTEVDEETANETMGFSKDTPFKCREYRYASLNLKNVYIRVCDMIRKDWAKPPGSPWGRPLRIPYTIQGGTSIDDFLRQIDAYYKNIPTGLSCTNWREGCTETRFKVGKYLVAIETPGTAEPGHDSLWVPILITTTLYCLNGPPAQCSQPVTIRMYGELYVVHIPPLTEPTDTETGTGAGKIDLTIAKEDITFSSATAEKSVITIQATVHNIGDAEANNVEVVFVRQEGEGRCCPPLSCPPECAAVNAAPVGCPPVLDQRVGRTTIRYIAPGGTGIAQFEFASSRTESSNRWLSISVVVDPDNRISESNEQNNKATRPVTGCDWNKARMALLGATLSPSNPELGTLTTLNLTLKNEGQQASSESTYVVYVDFYDVKGKRFDSIPTVIGKGDTLIHSENSKVSLPPIGPGGQRTVSLDFRIKEHLSPSMIFADTIQIEVHVDSGTETYEVGKASVDLQVEINPASLAKCFYAAVLTGISHFYATAGIAYEQFKASAGVVFDILELQLAFDEAIWYLNKSDTIAALNIAAEGIAKIVVTIVKGLIKDGTLNTAVAIFNFLKDIWDGAWGCGTIITFGIGYLQEVLRQGITLNFWDVLSPADIVITNDAGNRVGYMNGQTYQEIADSVVFVKEGKKFVFLLGDDNYLVTLQGTGNGKITLQHISPTGVNNQVKFAEAQNIAVNANTRIEMTYKRGGKHSSLRVDQNGDGSVDEIIEITETIPDASSATEPTTPAHSGGVGIGVLVGIILGTVVAGVVAFFILRPRVFGR